MHVGSECMWLVTLPCRQVQRHLLCAQRRCSCRHVHSALHRSLVPGAAPSFRSPNRPQLPPTAIVRIHHAITGTVLSPNTKVKMVAKYSPFMTSPVVTTSQGCAMRWAGGGAGEGGGAAGSGREHAVAAYCAQGR